LFFKIIFLGWQSGFVAVKTGLTALLPQAAKYHPLPKLDQHRFLANTFLHGKEDGVCGSRLTPPPAWERAGIADGNR
jgi:hypothetical protein